MSDFDPLGAARRAQRSAAALRALRLPHKVPDARALLLLFPPYVRDLPGCPRGAFGEAEIELDATTIGDIVTPTGAVDAVCRLPPFFH